MPKSFRVTPLPQEGVREAPTRVRVETEKGAVSSFLRPDGSAQTVKAPAGTTSWLKLTITDSVSRRAGLAGAGFTEIDLPDVQVTRLLRRELRRRRRDRLPVPYGRPRRAVGDGHGGRTAPALQDVRGRDVRGTGERRAGGGRGAGQAAVQGGAGAAEPDRRHRRLDGAVGGGPVAAQPHRRRPDHGLDRGRPAHGPPALAREAGGRRDRAGACGRPRHPAHRGAHQLAGRCGDRRGRRERLGPLPRHHDRPAGHHDHADGPADPLQPDGRRGPAPPGGPDRGLRPGAGPVPDTAAEGHPAVLAAVRGGAGRRGGRRAVPHERARNGTGPDGTTAGRRDALPAGR